MDMDLEEIERSLSMVETERHCNKDFVTDQ